MDTKERSSHLLGTFGIVGEVFKIIRSQVKVLGIITLVSILPPVLITLANIWLALYVRLMIDNDESEISWDAIIFNAICYSVCDWSRGARGFGNIITLVSILPPVLITLANIWLALYVRLMIDNDESEISWGLYILNWTEFLVVEVVWITFFYMGLMPSIAAVVYNVAGVYKGEQGITVESLPAVWKRMLITCMWHFLMSLVIVVGFGFIQMLSYLMLFVIPFAIGLAVLGGLGIYVTMLWHLASVMEEEYYGLAGLKRSRRLIHGKRLTAWGLLMFFIVFVGLFNFAAVVGNYYSVSFGVSLLYTVGYVVFASGITLMWEVTQSVLYG
ncbi:hypothetical protein SUGI_1197100 [Cryptomeria japonica]|nr:hypothetical protein SUGI_1197100 [Cryptomeria japonica]